MLIKKVEENTKGNDYICGDIHGSYSRITEFFDFINFDKEKDRLFSVGDIVDRGPENEKCLTLINEPWFHMVRGNHEQLMIEYFKGLPYGAYWSQNGGNWGTSYAKEIKENVKFGFNPSDTAIFVNECVNKIINFPLLITLELGEGKICHILHAELPYEAINDGVLANEEEFKYNAMSQARDGDVILWGRWLFGVLYKREITQQYIDLIKPYCEVNGITNNYMAGTLSHIYSGHTIMHKPTTIYNMTNLDTCAFGSYTDFDCGLTFTNPKTKEFWIAKQDGVSKIDPVVIE